MTAIRKMAVIFAGDVVGYSRLVGTDEEGTIARLKALQRDVVRPAIARHRGRVVKTTGDGILVEFASVVDALRAAIEIQQETGRRGESEPEEKRIVYRIGLHLGDVMVDGQDLLGDGVNIAARIEGLAEPGGIAISHQVLDHSRGKLTVAFADQGEHQVKNIERPVRVHFVRFEGYVADARATPSPRYVTLAAIAGGLLVAAGVAALVLWSQPAPPPAAPAQVAAAPATLAKDARPMMVVLPFANMSAEPNQEYFSDGITEDLTTALSRIPGFRVIARNSAFTYKGKPVNAQQVGRELGVRYMLEGSVQKQGDRLRLNVQLIDTTTGAHVWAEKYNRPLAEIFIAQDEIADKIVGLVSSSIRRREGEKAAAAAPEKLDAYELTMRARWLTQVQTPERVLEARRILVAATEKDPGYAPAYSRLSLVLNILFIQRINDEYGSAKTAEAMVAASAKALALMPNDSYALARHAQALTAVRQFDLAQVILTTAMAQNPQDADTASTLASVLNRLGQPERAVDFWRRAILLDPFFPIAVISSGLGNSLYFLGQYQEALDIGRQCAQRIPGNVSCRAAVAANLGRLGRKEEAAEAVADLLRISPRYNIRDERRAMEARFRRAEDVDGWIDGLRKAGVPE